MAEEAAAATEPEAAAPAPEATEVEQTGGEQSQSTPDIAEQISALKESVDSLKAPPEPDRYDGELGDLFLEDGEQQQQDGGEYDYSQPGDDALFGGGFEGQQDLDTYIQQRVQETVNPIFEAQAADKQKQELNALSEKYPDIMERDTLEAVGAQLSHLASTEAEKRAVFADPRLVELAYKAAKAETADADGTPAEQARARGATLETDAGAGEQTSEADAASEIKQSILAARSGSDAFS